MAAGSERRSRKNLAGPPAVATLVVACALLLGACGTQVVPTGASSSTEPTAAATASTSVDPAGESAEPAATQTSDDSDSTDADPAAPGEVGTVDLPVVDAGVDVAINSGIVVTVSEPRGVNIEAIGPGEISGAGIAVTVEIRNESESPLDLSGLAVNALYGDVPADTSMAEPSDPMRGSLAPGKEASGVYVFRMPGGASSDSLRIEVEHNGATDVVVVKP